MNWKWQQSICKRDLLVYMCFIQSSMVSQQCISLEDILSIVSMELNKYDKYVSAMWTHENVLWNNSELTEVEMLVTADSVCRTEKMSVLWCNHHLSWQDK